MGRNQVSGFRFQVSGFGFESQEPGARSMIETTPAKGKSYRVSKEADADGIMGLSTPGSDHGVTHEKSAIVRPNSALLSSTRLSAG
jgi:hypothetical protein